MGLLDKDKMRFIVFEDSNSGDNLGIMANDLEFIDITNVLPEFPEKLHDMLALDKVSLTLLDALYYEDKVTRIKSVRLKAPLCLEKYLWCYAENNCQKGVYLQALRGVSGNQSVLNAPFLDGLNFIPHIVFTTGGLMRKTQPREAIKNIIGFTLLNLGVVAPVADQKPLPRGLASQFENFSAAGPWLMMCTDCQAFFRKKTLKVLRNGQHLAEIKLNGIVSKAAEVMADLSKTMKVMPGDMLALPLHSAFEIVIGDTVSLQLESFGILKNIIGVS